MRIPALLASVALAASGCSGEDPPEAPEWTAVHEGLPGALLSVWGTAHDDVWAVGGDARDGTGPLVLHFDGAAWSRMPTGQTSGDLWWVFGFEGGPVFMGGSGGRILRFEGGAFTQMQTPSSATVFGIWGASPTDLWAVGGELGDTGGFAWRNDGSDTWTREPSLSAETSSSAAIWKAFGTSADDVWLVGSGATSLHFDGAALSPGDTGVGSSLFTVHARDGRYAAVGGLVSGVIVEDDGAGWRDVSPSEATSGLSGVCLGPNGGGYAVGLFGSIFARSDDGWTEVTQSVTQQNLHGVWIDERGGAWAVGGQTVTVPLTQGVLIYSGPDPLPEGDIQ